jgi:hypothetical protein
MRFITFLLFLVTFSSLNAADSQVADIIQRMNQKNQQRWQGIESYIVYKKMMDKPIITMHLPMRDENNQTIGFYQASPLQIQQMLEAVEGITPQMKRDFASGYMQGISMGLGALRSNVPLSPQANMALDEGVLGAGLFFSTAAPSDAQLAAMNAKDRAAVKKSFEDMAKFIDTARVVGSESIEGRNAYHLRSTENGPTSNMGDGTEFTPEETHVWIDKEELVILKFNVTGSAKNQGQTRRFTIGVTNSDFKEAAGALFEPFKQVMSMGGVLNDKEMAKMREAQQKLAEFEQQMARMPPDQKAMMERMMGNQLEMFRNMASTGAMEILTEVKEIKIGDIHDYKDMLLVQAKALGNP